MTEPTIPPAVAMEFKQTENESFETWLLRERARLNYLAGIVGRPARTFDQKKKLENLTAHLDNLLEDLSDVSLECHEHLIRSQEYYQDWLAIATKQELDLGWTKSKKTAQDQCVKTACSQRRVMDRLQAMCSTIEFRVTLTQSMIRSLKT